MSEADMIPGLYSAATAMTGAALIQDVLADNLANANVPGYRRREVATETFEETLDSAETERGDLWGSRISDVFDDLTQGPLQSTGNPLDLAAVGNTFFVLDGPTGALYTRNGVFRLNALGELESASGLRVRGEGGTITLPPETERIVVSRDGAVLADGQEVGRLQLVQIASAAGLQRAGTTLFEGGAVPAGQVEPGTILVEQGFREGSNVQPVHEMVAMITGMRHYEAAQRAMRGMAEALALSTRPQGES